MHQPRTPLRARRVAALAIFGGQHGMALLFEQVLRLLEEEPVIVDAENPHENGFCRNAGGQHPIR